MSSGSDTQRINFLQNLIQYITSQPGRRSLPGAPAPINFNCGSGPAQSISASCPQSASAAPCPAPIKCPENIISLQDQSTKSRYTPADLEIIIIAINKHLINFCNDWRQQKYIVKLYPATDTVSALFKIYLKDTSDVSGANSYHTVALDGSAVANIFIETIGGSRLFIDPAPLVKSDGIKRGVSVPATICHELIEMIMNRYSDNGIPINGSLNLQIDPDFGQVTDFFNGFLVDIRKILSEDPPSAILIPYRIIDAVQSNLVEVAEQSKVIHLSDYLLPDWFSQRKTERPSYNYLRNLLNPYHIDIGGYTIFLYKDNLYFNIYFLK